MESQVERLTKQLESIANPIPTLTGKWRGKWITSGLNINFEIMPDGRFITKRGGSRLRQVNGRVLATGVKDLPDAELIMNVDRIVLLGWQDKDYKTQSPDHIGVLYRTIE